MIEKSFKAMSKNDYEFSINISEDDLNQYYLLEYLKQKAKQYNILPSRVVLEILEGISTMGQKNNIKQLELLKKAGYR